MIYGYARVSTKGQARDGNSLDVQKTALAERGCAEENIFVDAFTGTKSSRPGLNRLLEQLAPGDIVMVTKLDRVARSASQGMELIDKLLDSGIEVDILNMGRMNNTPTGRLVRTIMLAFAEFERACIVERTNEGKEIARERPGFKEGRPALEIDSEKISKIKKAIAEGTMTKTRAASELGVSRSTFYKLIS